MSVQEVRDDAQQHTCMCAGGSGHPGPRDKPWSSNFIYRYLSVTWAESWRGFLGPSAVLDTLNFVCLCPPFPPLRRFPAQLEI